MAGVLSSQVRYFRIISISYIPDVKEMCFVSQETLWNASFCLTEYNTTFDTNSLRSTRQYYEQNIRYVSCIVLTKTSCVLYENSFINNVGRGPCKKRSCQLFMKFHCNHWGSTTRYYLTHWRRTADDNSVHHGIQTERP